ncbi:P3c host attachment protein [Pseudomonas phage phi13]|uniref:p3c n=1 Tax=Pseudomonas phage phi13 TaxID=134554 RepID=Q9FZT4_9VIRU|nr:P3c host attachment protein [Pseudomonas phage phi13]AAG00442.1 P3c [Pseudomonas phage phi13]
MDTSSLVPTLLGMAVGGGAGYLLGHNSVVQAEPDPKSDAAVIAGLNQRINLLQAQSEASTALIAAMKDQSSTGQAVQAQLQATIADLNSKLSGQQVTLFNNFPAVFGTGDPAVGGWIQGRDGLLISRILPNFIPNRSLIALAPGYLGGDLTTGISVSDLTVKANARPITIGKSVNNSLRMTHRNGIFGSMATILNFVEDVADDPDFICGGSSYDAAGSYPIDVMAIPIGRKSIMLLPFGFKKIPASWTYQQWASALLRDASAAGAAVPLPAVGARASYFRGGLNLALSHRTARSLTLRSWSIVAHPLAQWQETVTNGWTDDDFAQTRRQGDVSVVTRLNSSSVPKFYRPDETGAYPAVELAQSAYM